MIVESLRDLNNIANAPCMATEDSLENRVMIVIFEPYACGKINLKQIFKRYCLPCLVINNCANNFFNLMVCSAVS